MKNVLIYLQEGKLAKTGGQLGYNYVLKTQLDQRTDHSIHFLLLFLVWAARLRILGMGRY